MPSNFPIDEAYLVATWLSASLWGAFTIVFIACMVITFHTRKPYTKVVKSNIFLVIVMYGLATAHMSMVLARAIQGFINHAQDIGGPTLYFADISQPLNRSKDMIYITIIVVGDSVVWWRCCTVWNRNWFVVALPAIMIIATAISGFDAVGHYFLPSPDEDNAVAWATAMLAISMTTNILLTCVTAARVWYISQKTFASGSFRVLANRLMLLVIESGLIMSISKIVEFILFQLAPDDGQNGLNALYIVMDSMPQIMGICPTFIIIAINSGFDNNVYSATRGYSQSSGRISDAVKPLSLVPTQKSNSISNSSNHIVQHASRITDMISEARRPVTIIARFSAYGEYIPLRKYAE